MWCPSVSLTVWANAWHAGLAAPDDVLDALSPWAPRHSIAAYDAVAASRPGAQIRIRAGQYLKPVVVAHDLPPADTDHRRVLAVLRWIGA